MGAVFTPCSVHRFVCTWESPIVRPPFDALHLRNSTNDPIYSWLASAPPSGRLSSCLATSQRAKILPRYICRGRLVVRPIQRRGGSAALGAHVHRGDKCQEHQFKHRTKRKGLNTEQGACCHLRFRQHPVEYLCNHKCG